MSNDVLFFTAEDLERMARELFRANGSPAREAELMATRLVAANLVGHDSHGVLRIYTYLQWVRDKLVNPGATVSMVRDHGSTVIVDGHNGYGQVAAEATMEIAIERARAHGIAGVGVVNLMHVGRLADYAIQAGKAGMIALISTNVGGTAQSVAPFGGIKGRLATNPFAACFPSASHEPVVFDMATSIVAEGKLRVARDGKLTVDDHLIIDKEGNPTNDPSDFYDGGAILPVGGKKGYKGYLLAFMVEVLAGLLTDGGFVGKEGELGFNNCTFMIVIDVERFRPLDRFKNDIDQMIEHLKNTPSRPGEEVLYPGEVELRSERERRQHGIPLAAETVRKLQAELDRADIPMDLESIAAGAVGRA
jgi:uncharacterized oxidoreductase